MRGVGSSGRGRRGFEPAGSGGAVVMRATWRVMGGGSGDGLPIGVAAPRAYINIVVVSGPSATFFSNDVPSQSLAPRRTAVAQRNSNTIGTPAIFWKRVETESVFKINTTQKCLRMDSP